MNNKIKLRLPTMPNAYLSYAISTADHIKFSATDKTKVTIIDNSMYVNEWRAHQSLQRNAMANPGREVILDVQSILNTLKIPSGLLI